MTKRSFYVSESELDDYQRQVINKRTDSSFIVKGCAGSGKSILALWKVHDIVQNNESSVMMVVYTKALKTYMADAYREIGIDPDIVDYHNHWKNKASKKTKYLIVDEAQDFSRSDIKEFMDNSDILILYGDSAQQIYAWRKENPSLTIESIADLTGFSSEQLVFNHRLPKKVARVVEHIAPYDDELEMRCRGEGAEKPYILQYGSSREQLDAIAKIIKNRGFEDVGIFFSTNKGVEEASGYFRTIGLKNEAKYGSQMDLNFNSSNPKLLTYHSAKGLQFEAVFIPDCVADRDSDRSALYVAMTRTYQSLYIMHSGNLSPFFRNVSQDAYETDLSSRATEVL